MTATRQDIEGWVAEAQRRGARWLIVGRDNFDYDNYPRYVMAGEDIWHIVDHIGDNGTGSLGDSVDEVYDLELDIPSQLAERRAHHLPPRPSPTDGSE
jgi:hypothetical protein